MPLAPNSMNPFTTTCGRTENSPSQALPAARSIKPFTAIGSTIKKNIFCDVDNTMTTYNSQHHLLVLEQHLSTSGWDHSCLLCDWCDNAIVKHSAARTFIPQGLQRGGKP